MSIAKEKAVRFLVEPEMKILLVLICTLSALPAHSATVAGMPCADQKIQSERSAELQRIRKADQADRACFLTTPPRCSQKDFEKMSKNDLARRKRVGEIFGEGCFKTISDYEAAFLVYQHGNTPDQYFQAFVWSKKALTLGDEHVKSEIAEAIDRYLVSTGHKQLFGASASEVSVGGCWCIPAIEDSFPDSLREEYRGGGNAAYTGLAYLAILNKGTSCPVAYCDGNLLPSPAGSVPGFW